MSQNKFWKFVGRNPYDDIFWWARIKFWTFVGRNPAEEMFWADLGCFSVASLIPTIIFLDDLYDNVSSGFKHSNICWLWLFGYLLLLLFSYHFGYETYKELKLERILIAKNKTYSKKTLFFRGAIGGILSLTLWCIMLVIVFYSFDLAVSIDRLIHS